MLKIAAAILFVLLVLFLTQPAYLGDTARYINEILNHRAHVFNAAGDPFWDFGHAVWRPLVNELFDGLGRPIEAMTGGDTRETLARLMIAINIVSALAAVLLCWLFLKGHTDTVAATIGTAAFLCTNSILDYSHSGNPYLPALTCLLLALWLMQVAHRRSGAVFAILAGIGLGASILLWFPFVLVAPAALLYALYGSPKPPVRTRMRMAAAAAVSAGVLVAVTYGVVIHERRIHTFAELRSWIDSSRNEWAQTDKVKRAVSGIPRSFLDMGDDTLLLKRYVFRDPYAPVSFSRILLAQGTLKLVLFYLCAAAIVLALWKEPGGRRILMLLAAAALPVLIFAVTLFEPGSTERYMPVYPFFFLAAAYALATFGRGYRALQWFIAAFLIVVLCAGNIYAKNTWRGAAVYRAYTERKQMLETQARPGAMVALINFFDPLYQIPPLRLLDHQAQPQNYAVYDVIETANARVFRWRQQFAERSQKQWSQGNQVWLSARLVADRPLPEWTWVEGDTGRVKWSELRDFFRSFDVQSRTGGKDGFILLADDAHNAEYVRQVAGEH
jgi:Dolichyl-phosphate-mannose-protein mannosyltransferase